MKIHEGFGEKLTGVGGNVRKISYCKTTLKIHFSILSKLLYILITSTLFLSRS